VYVYAVSGKSLHFLLNNFNKFKLTFTIFCIHYTNVSFYQRHLKLIFKMYLSLSIANVSMTSLEMPLSREMSSK